MRLSKTAQSFLEYCLVILLVGAGVIMMSPYVIRSVNANLKLWEDGVNDSVNDPLRSGNLGNGNIPSCSCGPLKNVGCGLHGATAAGQCSSSQMFQNRDCSFCACDPAVNGACENCVDDPTCCSPWVASGPCGANGACQPIERMSTRTCGVAPPETKCVVDSICMGNAQCTGNQFDHASLCAGDDQQVGASTPYVLVDTCSQGAKCEMTCENGYTRTANGCAAPVCGNSVIEGDEQCDDGNTATCDGCDSSCHNETPVNCGNGTCDTCETAQNCIDCPVQVAISGCDCFSVSCPADRSYVVGCNIGRGGKANKKICIASSGSGIYFKEGSDCNGCNEVAAATGTITCSATPPTQSLNSSNCSVIHSQGEHANGQADNPSFVSSPNQCP